MLNLLLTAALALNPATAPAPLDSEVILSAVQERGDKEDEEKVEEKELDPKEVEAIVEALKEAFKSGSEITDRLDAIEAALMYPHEDVAKAVAKGIKDKEPEVVMASILGLARLKHPAALKELVSAYKRERSIKKDDKLFAATLKAIGSYGDPDQVTLLSDDLFENTNKEVIRARIFGLGNTRCKEAVEELISIMSSSAPKYINPHMTELNLALFVLTGTDEGKSRDRWFSWWNENKRTLKISKEVGKLGKQDQAKWEQYWDLEAKQGGRQEKKEKREEPGA